MFCPKCGRKCEENAAFCAECGSPLPKSPFSDIGTSATANKATASSKVEVSDSIKQYRLIIRRKKQLFAVNPPMAILIDENIQHSIENGAEIIITLPAGRHFFKIKSSIRKKEGEFILKEDSILDLSWNRATGAIESVFSEGSPNKATPENPNMSQSASPAGGPSVPASSPNVPSKSPQKKAGIIVGTVVLICIAIIAALLIPKSTSRNNNSAGEVVSNELQTLSEEEFIAAYENLDGKNIAVHATVTDTYPGEGIEAGVTATDSQGVTTTVYIYLNLDDDDISKYSIGDDVLISGKFAISDGVNTFYTATIEKIATSDVEKSTQNEYVSSGENKNSEETIYDIYQLFGLGYWKDFSNREVAIANIETYDVYPEDCSITVRTMGETSNDYKYIDIAFRDDDSYNQFLMLWECSLYPTICGIILDDCTIINAYVPEWYLESDEVGNAGSDYSGTSDYYAATVDIQEFFDNKARAKAYYNGQYVLVTGSKVLSISDDHIAVDNDEFNFDSAAVYFTNIEQIFSLSQGQYIEFEGYCEYDEFLEEFRFTDCTLIY